MCQLTQDDSITQIRNTTGKGENLGEYICVHVCIYMCACVCTCGHVCVHVCMCEYIHTHRREDDDRHWHPSLRHCDRTHTHTHTCTDTYIHTRTHKYIHTRMQYTHTHTHTEEKTTINSGTLLLGIVVVLSFILILSIAYLIVRLCCSVLQCVAVRSYACMSVIHVLLPHMRTCGCSTAYVRSSVRHETARHSQ